MTWDGAGQQVSQSNGTIWHAGIPCCMRGAEALTHPIFVSTAQKTPVSGKPLLFNKDKH